MLVINFSNSSHLDDFKRNVSLSIPSNSSLVYPFDSPFVNIYLSAIFSTNSLEDVMSPKSTAKSSNVSKYV